jgi:hypothetical protein
MFSATMDSLRSRAGLACAAVLVAVGGCSAGSPPTTSSSGAGASAPASPATSVSASEAPRSLTIDILPLGDYTAHGTVVIDIYSGGYQMTVRVLGLEPNSLHWLNMHGGTCARQFFDPAEMISLGDLQADASGQGTLMTPLFPYPYQLPTGGRILTVHNLPSTDNSPYMAHVACADLTS